jgi:hypothetical protein
LCSVDASTGYRIEVGRTRNPDLFWALRDARHDFVILTSVWVGIEGVGIENISTVYFYLATATI